MSKAQVDVRFSRKAFREAVRDEDGVQPQRRERRGNRVLRGQLERQATETFEVEVIHTTMTAWTPGL